jgi:outer membrane protein assembly factor BamB
MMNDGVSNARAKRALFPSARFREQRRPFARLLSLLVALLLLPSALPGCSVGAPSSIPSARSKLGGPSDLYLVQNGSAYRLAGSSGKVIWHDHLSVSAQSGSTQSQVVNGVMYILFYSDMYALDARNGQQIWHVPNPTPHAYFWFVVDSGHVYLYSLDSTFSALNAADGSTLWHNTTFKTENGSLGSVSDGTLYVPNNSSNELVALDSVTGQVRWDAPMPQGSSSQFQAPLVNNGVVYFASGNLLYALNEQSGERIWEQRVPIEGSFAAASLGNGILYVTNITPIAVADSTSTDARNFFAFNAGTGQLLWTSRPADELLSTVPITDGPLLVSRGSSIAGLDPQTGRTAWQVPFPCAGDQVLSATCTNVWTQVVGGQLDALGSASSPQDQFFYTFNRFNPSTGRLLSEQQLAVTQDNVGGNGGAIGESNGLFYFRIALPRVANNIPYANYSFTAYRLSNGTLAWSQAMPPFPPPISANIAPNTSLPVLAP